MTITTLSHAIEIVTEGNRFLINFKHQLGYFIRGASEWHELVNFLDAMTVERMEKVIARLKDKTGHDWVMPTGPAPS